MHLCPCPPDPRGAIKLIRLNPLIQPVRYQGAWNYPGYPNGSEDSLNEDEFATLVKMDMDAVDDASVELIAKFCDLWIRNIAPNQSIQHKDDLSCRIGFGTFDEAKIVAENIGLV